MHCHCFQFILKENPEKQIFHTIQVERNGFIHSMVTGTSNEAKACEHFGPRAYAKLIPPELPPESPLNQHGTAEAKQKK